MANGQSLVVPGHGTIFHAPVGTALPADPLTAFTLAGDAPAGWVSMGHTSRQNVVSFESTGGETSKLGSYLADAVREINTSAAEWSVSVGALELTIDTLDLAFNGEWDAAGKRYLIPATAAPIERKVFLLLADDTASVGFELFKASIKASGAPTIDPSQFMEVPITASLLTPDGDNLPPLVGGKLPIIGFHADFLTASQAG